MFESTKLRFTESVDLTGIKRILELNEISFNKEMKRLAAKDDKDRKELTRLQENLGKIKNDDAQKSQRTKLEAKIEKLNKVIKDRDSTREKSTTRFNELQKHYSVVLENDESKRDKLKEVLDQQKEDAQADRNERRESKYSEKTDLENLRKEYSKILEDINKIDTAKAEELDKFKKANADKAQDLAAKHARLEEDCTEEKKKLLDAYEKKIKELDEQVIKDKKDALKKKDAEIEKIQEKVSLSHKSIDTQLVEFQAKLSKKLKKSTEKNDDSRADLTDHAEILKSRIEELEAEEAKKAEENQKKKA